jgi:hypothetical protein
MQHPSADYADCLPVYDRDAAQCVLRVLAHNHGLSPSTFAFAWKYKWPNEINCQVYSMAIPALLP